jgi:hypothetical protein
MASPIIEFVEVRRELLKKKKSFLKARESSQAMTAREPSPLRFARIWVKCPAADVTVRLFVTDNSSRPQTKVPARPGDFE